ncbi:hypothetical protein Patl1_36846 [Pistacia atlantica]|nr:hypothetical protein Patl1_36846 [Pistacia atlantica]
MVTSRASITIIKLPTLPHKGREREREMELTQRGAIMEEEEELEIWNYTFGFVKIAVVKCAIELGIAEAIENHGGPMTLSELSSSLNCAPSSLHRIMRFLVHYRLFKETPTSHGSIAFEQTPMSRRLLTQGHNSLVALFLLESSPVMLAPWHRLGARVLAKEESAFETAHGKDLWTYTAVDEGHSKLLNDAMASMARGTVPAVIEGCPEVFDGIGSLVDVGGGNGTALGLLVKGFPWIRGINFDLPHVVCAADQEWHGVEHVGGDMFQRVPMADAVFIMQVLHDWGDNECIQILKKCRESIPKEKGKVIIVETIIEEEEEERDKFKFVRLMLDMVMMAHTNKGKERTLKEWDYVLGQAGFSRYNVKPSHAVQSVIEAFP